MKYRVLVPISYPTDAKVIRRLERGQVVQPEELGEIRSLEVGDVAEDIPVKSISWLVQGGIIEAVEEPKAKAKAKNG